MGSVPIPFFDRNDDHHITLEIEVDERGSPPAVAEIIGPDEDGAITHHFYRLEELPGQDPEWRYVETHREGPSEPPEPGSPEALERVRGAREWPGT